MIRLFHRQAPRSNLWRLLYYVKPYWPSFLAATLCGVIKLLTPFAVIWLIGQIVDILHNLGAGKLAIDAAWAQLRHYAILGFGLSLLAPIPIYLRSTLASRAVQLVLRNLRCDLYAHIQKLSHSFFDVNRSGSLTNRIIGDIDTVQPFISKAFVQVWMSIGMIAIVLWYFFSKNVLLACLTLLMIPIQLTIQRAIGWKVRENSKAIRDQMARLAGNTQEKLAASTIVKAFTREDDEVQRFSDESGELVELGIKNTLLGGLSDALLNCTKFLGQIIVLVVGGYLTLFHPNLVSLGLLLQFVFMQNQLFMPFDWLNEMQLIIAAALGATDRIFGIFDTEPEIADSPHAIKAPAFQGEISFEHVVFSYPGGSQPIFTDLNLRIPKHTTLALVGSSGGGKTTITNLLDRFYDWDAGDIKIDGRDIRDYTIFSLRSQIGLVPQEPILFSGSIADNILYGRPDATEAEVREAARKAYALDFIEESDDGFETMLGERGVRLSGGQKQRISIARAFLKDPAIIVLDEATSALDSESERIVQLALEDLMQDRTTIVIAHRLATIQHADQIAVIDSGQVVELGRHDELIAEDGIYAMLCRQQFGDAVANLSAEG